ncbi:putative RNA polymerase II nuclear localization protein SLC7A6OS isoform X2 [Tubulanus polymorphus]|uniref:putative RNA polymerase II nuclear localization protein SLC7A6OS isoform X2 n=1 Tax=Tubulanus polymorphus TaxID=672921 RepID=UPI003DA2AE34
MAAVVRIKRKINEEPAEKLVLCCKRQRKNDSDEVESNTESVEVTTALKFAGTLVDKSQSVSKTVRDAIRKAKLEKEYKGHGTDITSNVRDTKRQSSKANRLKVSLRNRALNLESLDKESSDNSAVKGDVYQDATYSLYDLETEAISGNETVTCNSVPMVRESTATIETAENQTDYVYDVYYLNQRQFDFRLLEDVMTIEAYNEDYMFNGYRDDGDLNVYDDEDDSNDEDNWRNDYPDEDPRFYENEDCDEYGDYSGFDEENLRSRMKKCSLAVEENLSSDEENDIWTPQRNYDEYKKDVIKELYGEGVESSDDEDYLYSHEAGS